MRFKIDENLPVECAQLLRDAGFEADTVDDEFLSGTDDTLLAECCLQESRVLVTLDLDFANIRNFPPDEYRGFVVLRTKRQDKYTVLALLARILVLLKSEDPAHQLWIVEEDRIRVR